MEPEYHMIGADGQEYGPATLEELKSWIREGRVAPQSQLRRGDQTGWSPAADFPELREELGRPGIASLDVTQAVLEPVGFLPRAGAYVLDTILLQVVLNGVMFDPSHLQFVMYRGTAGVFVSAAYFILMHGRFGATIGKMVIGAKVVNEDGSPISYGRATLRYLGSILSGMICCIGYLMVAFRDDKRALHDLLARTRVVHKR